MGVLLCWNQVWFGCTFVLDKSRPFVKLKLVYNISIMAKRATSVGKNRTTRSKKTAKRLAVKHAKIAARTTTKRRK